MFGRKVKVTMDDGSHKVVPMVEGSGVFTCHTHEFVTESLEDFNMHLKTEEHPGLDAGSTGVCVICNTAGVDMTGYPPGEEPVCDKCEHRIARSRARVHEKLDNNKKVATKK